MQPPPFAAPEDETSKAYAERKEIRQMLMTARGKGENRQSPLKVDLYYKIYWRLKTTLREKEQDREDSRDCGRGDAKLSIWGRRDNGT